MADHRLDPYRSRVAILRRDGVDVGHLLVQVRPWSEVLRGHLWWRRWTLPVEVPHVTVAIPGGSSDQYIPADAIHDELARWARGTHDHYGDQLELSWLGAEESQSCWPGR